MNKFLYIVSLVGLAVIAESVAITSDQRFGVVILILINAGAFAWTLELKDDE